MAVALLALILTVGGGTAFALRGKNTVFSNDIANRQVKRVDLAAGAVRAGKVGADAIRTEKVLDDSLTGADIDESTLGQVPAAASAGNAAQLGGKAAAVYLDGCDQGTVHGFAKVAASGTFSATFTTTGVTPSYNCTGGTVQARRVAQGVYRVRFNGNGSQLAVGSVDANGGGVDDFVAARAVSDGGTAIEVQVRDAGGGNEDVPFVIMIM
jgi:hypothetical protein